MTIEKFLHMYDGNCAIVVKRGNEIICPTTALDLLNDDEWFKEERYSEVESFAIVPDETQEGAVSLLIKIK